MPVPSRGSVEHIQWTLIHSRRQQRNRRLISTDGTPCVHQFFASGPSRRQTSAQDINTTVRRIWPQQLEPESKWFRRAIYSGHGPVHTWKHSNRSIMFLYGWQFLYSNRTEFERPPLKSMRRYLKAALLRDYHYGFVYAIHVRSPIDEMALLSG